MRDSFVTDDKMVLGILLCAFFTVQVTSQSPDIFRIEYMLMPKNKAAVEFTRFKILANVPIKVREKDNIIIGGEYNYLSQEFGENDPIAMGGVKGLHVVDFNLAYVYRYNEDWRFIGVATPRLSSSLTNRVVRGDVSANITVGAFKNKQNIDKPIRLVFGITYNSTVALRIPLPIVYYEKRFHPNWSYVVGVPKTGLKYHLKERHMIQTEIILDGYFVNLQNNIILPDSGIASSISSSAALFTIGYQYNITKSMSFYGYGGHTLFQKAVLNNQDRNDIFTLNDEPSLYFRAGFRIGI
ncbi:MAG: hypothetical protein KJO52_12320 [Maribacter sp.]|nr:hypothetical protein [Maribacter sp.]